MHSKTALALFAALTASVSVAALPASYEYVDLAERDYLDNAELVERDFFDNVDLVERDLFDVDYEELAARQDPGAGPVPDASAQAVQPPAQTLSAPPTAAGPMPGHRGHGHGHGHAGLGHHGHGHGHGFKHPAHHYKADGTLKSKSARRRANKRLRKQLAAQQAQAQAPPSPGPDPSQAPTVVAREIELEERGLLETLGLKARVVDLSTKQTAMMNHAKQVCDSLATKKDKKKCHKKVDKIIQMTKERNYEVGQFGSITSHHDIFPADPNFKAPTTSST